MFNKSLNTSWTHQPGLVAPFGKRNCPGKKLTEREMAVVVAKTFYNFEADLIVGGRPLKADFKYLLYLPSDLGMRFY